MPARNLLTALLLIAVASPAFAQAAQSRVMPRSTLFPLDHFWSLSFDSPFSAPPAADDRRVYVPLATGQLVAYEPGRDEPVWSVELATDTAPIAADGQLYVHAAGALHALDAATGTLRWRLPAGGLAVPPVARSGWLILALADGGLQAVRGQDGVVLWAHAMRAALTSPPSIDGNMFAAAFADGRLALIDIATGAPTWERSLGSRPGGITLSGDRIFVATEDGHFLSIKTRDGDLDWRWRVGSRIAGAPAADEDRIYVVAFDNIVRAFSRGSGHVRWSHSIPTRALSGPLLIDGLVVITSAQVGAPGLTYINAKTGVAAGKTPALEPTPEETTRVQFPAVFSAVLAPPAVNTPRFAAIVTATTAGDWHLHAYRQTFAPAFFAEPGADAGTPGPFTWGKLYEVRLRLDIWTGPIVWGEPIILVPPVPQVPKVP